MKTIVIDARKIKSSTGRYVFELCTHLEAIDTTNRYKVIVLPEEADYYRPTNPNFTVVTCSYKHYTFDEQLGFNHFLRALKPDLVHFYMPQQPLLYTKPAITTVHDLNLLRITDNDMGAVERFVKKKIFAALLWVVARRTRHIITPTQFTKDDLVSWSHVSPEKVTVTYEGVYDLKKTKPTPKYSDVPYFMYLGRAEPYKNNRRMIEAHQRLLRTKPELKLLIVGAIDDLRKADMDWVKQNGYKNVDFLGWLPDEEAAWLYQRAIAYVGPSYLEGFGLPALEAMYQGAPVVSANTTCSPEVFGDAAHYFDPFSIDDITRAMNDVMTDAKLRKQLIMNGRSQVKKYSWRRMAEQTHAIYIQTLNHSLTD
ncbi:MAG TPA: glycosyltransferase family 1 protein [Magnetospirillaceae bacterium]|nr:glycosyltransferase family 1 protein [Magnetospirillaceae bacterium]